MSKATKVAPGMGYPMSERPQQTQHTQQIPMRRVGVRMDRQRQRPRRAYGRRPQSSPLWRAFYSGVLLVVLVLAAWSMVEPVRDWHAQLLVWALDALGAAGALEGRRGWPRT